MKMKKIKKHYLIIGCLLASFSSAVSFATPAAPTHSLDKIVAIVNDDVVTHSELKRALSIAKMQIAQSHAPSPSEQQLTQEVLKQLIDKKLELQIAKQAGVNISDDELDETIKGIADQNQMTVTALYQRINQEGMSTTAYKEEMREQLTLHKLQQQEVVSHVNISKDEVTSFLNSRLWHHNSAKEYHLLDLVVPLADTPTPEQVSVAKAKAEAIIARFQASKGLKNATDLGWRSLPELPSAFTSAVGGMEVKTVSSPIRAANGFHVIELVDEHELADNQAGPSRDQVKKMLLQQKFQEAIQNWISRLHDQAFISIQL
jgi:peptidyl-prolyl cis-trans isomerase SurA